MINGENEMLGEESQPQDQEEKNNPFEQPTPEELWMMQQYPQMMPQQNPFYALTQLMYALMPLIMMGSMTSGMFLQKAWIPPAERSRLVETYGEWATSRAEMMIPSSAGIPAVEAAAKHMWERYQATIGITAPAARPRKRPTVVRARAATLTESEISSLADEATTFYADKRRKPNIAEVRRWAEDLFAKRISAEDVSKVMLRAFP